MEETELIRRAMSAIGKRTSEAKTDAARKNCNEPPRPSSRPRGRPKKIVEDTVVEKEGEQADGN